LVMDTERSVDARRVLTYVATAIASLVKALEQSPGTPALDLSVLPEAECREVLEGFNPVWEYRQEKLIQELFEERVRLHPQATAVAYETESMTYAELNA